MWTTTEELCEYRITVQFPGGVEDTARILACRDDAACNEALDTLYRDSDKTVRQLGGRVTKIHNLGPLRIPIFLGWSSSLVHHAA